MKKEKWRETDVAGLWESRGAWPNDGLIATYVALECVGDQVNVRMVRGKIQRVFPVMISWKAREPVLHNK